MASSRRAARRDPRLVRCGDADCTGRARVGADETGRLYDHGAVEQFAASHKVLMFVTGVLSRLLGEQGDVSDPHFRLFGRAGERGPDLLRRSIKYHVSR